MLERLANISSAWDGCLCRGHCWILRPLLWCRRRLNQYCCKCALHPHEPDYATGYTLISDKYLCMTCSIAIFFINKCHHKMSAWAALLSLMWCIWYVRAHFLKCIQSLEKWHKTLNTNWSRPVMDRRAFFEITLFDTTCHKVLFKT